MVRVQGALDDSWASQYATMKVTVDHAPDGPATTTLVGRLKDQVDLVGLIVHLFEWGHPHRQRQRSDNILVRRR